MEEEYDLQFDSSVFDNPDKLLQEYKQANTGDSEFARNTDFGDSIFDNNFFPELTVNDDFKEGDYTLEDSINENRSENQPWISKFGSGLGRVGTKVISEISKMPGVVIGSVAGAAGQVDDLITGEDNNDFMQIAFNNPWIKAINEINEDVNSEMLPVYVSKAVSEGNLWDNISSIDFWATEGADGLGYIASMLAPGAVINKFGLGAKTFSGLNKFAKMSSKTDEALNTLNKLGINAKNADLHSATLANTIFEAGAEAQSAMDSYEKELTAQLEAGQITNQEYDNKMSNSSEIGRKIFMTNAAILLLGPNAIMSKILWGKKGNSFSKNTFKDGQLQKLNVPAISKRVKLFGDDFAKATLREGFFEEGLQSTTEEFFSENPEAGAAEFLSELPSAYLDMISKTDGQKAILLGAAFGGGMQAYSGSKDRKLSRENTNRLINKSKGILNDIYSVFNEDSYRKKDGEIVYDSQGEPILDSSKVLKKMQGLESLENVSKLYDQAIQNNNVELLEQIEDAVTTNFVKPFILNEDLGIEILRNSLEEQIKNIPQNNQKDSFVENIISKAEKLKDNYNTFSNFSEQLIKLDNKDANSQDKIDFYNIIANDYINNKARELYLEDKLNYYETLLNNILESKGKSPQNLEENKLPKQELINTDSRIDKLIKDLNNINNSISQVKKANEKFWDGKTLSKQFNSEIKNKKNLEKLQSNESEVNNLIEQIKNVTTVEDLNNISSQNKDIQDILQNIKDSRRNEIISEKDSADSIKKEDNIQYDADSNIEKDQSIDDIINNYNVGERVTYLSKDYTIKNIKESSALLIDDSGKQVGISTKIKSFNNERNYSTEGTDTTQTLIVLDQKDKKFDAKVISTDSNGNKLSFVEESVLEFERVPRNKIGEKVGFEINTTQNLSTNQIAAKKSVDNNDFSDLEFIIDHLPINVKLNDSVKAPIETLSETSGNYNEIFNKSSRLLRRAIINELKDGKEISNITSEIIGQKNGTIQLEPTVIENSLLGLYEINDDIKNIKSNNLYIVDDLGVLKNINGDRLNASRSLAPGEIYLKINTANGTSFPLKLNIKKINNTQAELLYELYKYRFEDIKEGKSIRISETNEELYNSLQQLLPNEIKWFNQNKKATKDISVKDIVDFLIWDGSKSSKSQVRFIKGNLYVADKIYTPESFKDSKDEFIRILTFSKRHHVKYKRKPSESINAPSLENRNYLEYLINNNILNTNVKINQPTFQGNTSIYISKDKVKVNNKLSKYNRVFKKIKKEVSKDIKVKASEFDIKAQSGINFSKFGIDLPKKKKAKVKSKYSFLNNSDLKKLTEQVNNTDYIISQTPLTYNKKQYYITNNNFYVLNITDNSVVENLKTIEAIIDTYNDKMSKIDSKFTYDKSKLLTVWKNRINKTTDSGIDFNSINNPNELRKNLSLAYPQYIKDIQIISKKKVSDNKKLEETFKMLESKNIKKEEIKVKCGL